MGIFDSIKNAFGSKDESEAPAAESAAPEVAESDAAQPEAPANEGGQRTYTVQSGDTLWKIAEQMYGNGSKYTKIFDANTDLLDHPDHIFPGQELVIPDLN